MNSRQPDRRVIAFSGTSCAGKTSLIRRTAELLGEAACLHFDDYAAVSEYPADLAAWVAAGADPNAWRTPALAADLRALKQGRAVSLPGGKGVVEPRPYLLVEEPLGRARAEMAPEIDLVVYLDLPPDVAIVRKIRRDARRYTREAAQPDLWRWLDDFCAFYLEGPLRAVYQAASEKVRAGADLVLDATRPLEELARAVAQRAAALQECEAAARIGNETPVGGE
jgi:uridine kinase